MSDPAPVHGARSRACDPAVLMAAAGVPNFAFAATPHIHFGSGARARLPGILDGYGRKVLLVSGHRSLQDNPPARALIEEIEREFELARVQVRGEPSPELVDAAVAEHRAWNPDVVLAIGGGSAVDAGKAIAGLIRIGDSVMEYLEGVGRGKAYRGPSAPFVAVPTTAGTGGETSKNAVLSRIGPDGFKKSFRHERLVARHVVVDPELTLSCPPHVTAACGMDALTQLIESYASCKATPMTDALAESGLRRAGAGLVAAFENGGDLAAREAMHYASMISGLTLANAGLGSVHGLASPIGAFFPMPHGEVCGTLVAEAVRVNLEAIRARDPGNPARAKYAHIGRMLSGRTELSGDEAADQLVELLASWVERLKMPRLSDYGVTRADVPRIIANISGGSMSGNPIVLAEEEIRRLIESRL